MSGQTLHRSFVLGLSLLLALPSPAFCLRAQSGLESDAKEDLDQALKPKEPLPNEKAPDRIPLSTPDLLRFIEEKTEKKRSTDRKALEQSPNSGLEAIGWLHRLMGEVAETRNWQQLPGIFQQMDRFYGLGAFLIAATSNRPPWDDPAVLGEVGIALVRSFGFREQVSQMLRVTGVKEPPEGLLDSHLPSAGDMGRSIRLIRTQMFGSEAMPSSRRLRASAGESAYSAEAIALGAHLLGAALQMSVPENLKLPRPVLKTKPGSLERAIQVSPAALMMERQALTFARTIKQMDPKFDYWKPSLIQDILNHPFFGRTSAGLEAKGNGHPLPLTDRFSAGTQGDSAFRPAEPLPSIELSIPSLLMDLQRFVNSPSGQRAIVEGNGFSVLGERQLGSYARSAAWKQLTGVLLKLDREGGQGRELQLAAGPLFAQPKNYLATQETQALTSLRWNILPEDIRSAVAEMMSKGVGSMKSVALFDGTQDPAANRAIAERIEAEMKNHPGSENVFQPAVVHPGQVASLYENRILDYYARASHLPPVVVVVVEGELQSEAGETYAFALSL